MNINSVPDGATAGIDVRVVPGLDSDEVEARLARAVGDEVRLEPRGLAYFTDASALTPAYGTPPTIIRGPGDPGQAHQTDESCSVELLDATAEGIFEIARRWCRL